MKKIAVYGGSGFGREVAMLIEHINARSPEWEMIGFFDDGMEPGTFVNGYPVLGNMDTLNAYPTELHVAYAIGNPVVKRSIITRVSNDAILSPVLIHPSAWVGDRKFVGIGKGVIITAACILTVNIEIGDYVILNLGCTVGHDTQIGAFSSFMPGVNISGEVVIEEGVYVGTGAKIINQLEIGAYTVVGAGAVVSKSLPAHCTAVGIPAKPIKFHTPA